MRDYCYRVTNRVTGRFCAFATGQDERSAMDQVMGRIGFESYEQACEVIDSGRLIFDLELVGDVEVGDVEVEDV